MSDTADGRAAGGISVGIDVGGTKCLGRRARPRRRGHRRGSSAAPRGGRQPAEADRHAGRTGRRRSVPYDALGVGVPGLVTRDGVLRAAPNLDGVADFDVAGLLRRAGRAPRARRQRRHVRHAWPSGSSAPGAAPPTWCSSRSVPASAAELVCGGRLQRGKQRFRRRVRPHGRRSRRSTVPVRPARLLGALRVRFRVWRGSLARRRSDVG